MTKKPVTDIAASVKQRLINRARADGTDVNLYWTRYAAERLLYRLSVSPHAGDFILKGAMLLVAWSDLLLRPTLDLDLLGPGEDSVERLQRVFREIAAMPVDEDDGLRFDPDSVRAEPIRDGQEYQGKRVTMRVALGNISIALQVDVGFGDIITPGPEGIAFPTLLDQPAPQLRASTRETAIAEKFHVMVTRGLTNSRLKDYFDIWVLSRRFTFDRRTLATALRATFERRRTALPASRPVAVTDAYAEQAMLARAWTRLIRRTEAADRSLAQVVRDLAGFIEPVLIEPGEDAIWESGGPWR